MRSGPRSRAIALPALATVLLWLGCGGGADLTGPPTGSVQLTIATGGSEPDPDGYVVRIDGGAPTGIGVNASRLVEALSVGTHGIDLSGLASNCSLPGGSHLDVEVPANAVATASFSVTCAATIGALAVTTTTAGPSPDADGYELTIDGGSAQPIGPAATVTLPSVSAGTHSVALGGLAANCEVEGDNPRAVTVTAGATTALAISVTCAPPTPPPATGSISVTTQTTGPDQDGDGYAVTLDGGEGRPIGPSARLAIPDVGAGEHAVGLSGISANCRLDGDNPRTAVVTSGAVAAVTFRLACDALPPATGSLALTTVTTGPAPDPDGYRFDVDGGDAQPVGINATVTISSLTQGPHAVRLRGASPNCAIAGDNPRAVTIAAGGTAEVTFSVACAATTGSLELTVGGLPAGVGGAVTVTGPGGFSAPVTATTTLSDLAPGSYAVTAREVTSGGVRYTASPASQTVTLSANATARVTVTYGPAAGPTLNLRVDGIELIQSVQTPVGTIPLVSDRDGLLRVFVLANETNSAAPSVRVRLLRNGALAQTFTIPATRGSTPTARDEGDLAGSWNVKIPRAQFTPGLTVLAEVDPGNAVAESDEGDNSYPISGTPQTQTLRTVPDFALRFVPIRQKTSGAQGGVTEGSRGDFLRLTRRIYPIAEVDGDVHPVYTTSTSDALEADDANGAWGTILSELDVLRLTEGTSRTYYGVVHVDYPSGVAGLGYIGRPTAMGYDREVDQSRVMAHELGHTWHRLHSPCGQPAGVDPDYPHPGGTIGVYGFDLQDNVLRSPSSPDVMGYCGDPWISDYTYQGVLDYRIATQAGNARAAARAAAQRCLIVWGRIVNGRPVLEPAFEVVTQPSLPRAAGPYRLEGYSADGARVLDLAFDAAQVADDRRGSRHFAFAVPLEAAAPGRLATLQLAAPGGAAAASRMPAPAAAAATGPALEARSVGGGVRLRWDAAAHPMIMVRDPATGDVLSLARGGEIDLATTQPVLDVVLSDRIGSRTVRVAVAR